MRRIAKLSVPIDGASLPTEFRLFVSGENTTTKGTFLFDAEAAEMVMAAYEEHGVSLAIDLEHQMLEGGSPDPTARDARGWCQLELRPDGSLWATAVRWTPDGAQRLTERRQRYVSPAFAVDSETNRISKVVNVAIVAMPATHNTPALVAAAERKKTMQQRASEMVPGAADAAAEKTLEEVAGVLGLEPPFKAKDIVAAVLALTLDGAPATEEKAPEEKAPAEELSTRKSLLRLSGAHSLAGVLGHVQSLARQLQDVQAERDEFAHAERIRLCSALVVDAGRAPATVWADPFVKGTPKPHLQRMTIAELRAHLADEVGASVGQTGARKAPRAPATASAAVGGRVVTTSYGAVDVSAREVVMCSDMKIDLQEYASRKAQQQARGQAGAR